MKLTENFWADGLDLLFANPLAALEPDQARAFYSAHRVSAGLRKAHVRARESSTIEAWREVFEASRLDREPRFEEAVRARARSWLATPTPARRLQLFWLRELWARAHAYKLAAKITVALEPDFDDERALDRAPLSALASLAWATTLAGHWRGLTIVELPADWSLVRVKKHLGSRSSWCGPRYERPETLTFEALEGQTRSIGVRKRANMSAEELVAVIRDHFDPENATPRDPIPLVDVHERFLDETLPEVIDQLMDGAEAYVARSTDLTCCGSHTVLVHGEAAWLAVQNYRYC